MDKIFQSKICPNNIRRSISDENMLPTYLRQKYVDKMFQTENIEKVFMAKMLRQNVYDENIQKNISD